MFLYRHGIGHFQEPHIIQVFIHLLNVQKVSFEGLKFYSWFKTFSHLLFILKKYIYLLLQKDTQKNDNMSFSNKLCLTAAMYVALNKKTLCLYSHLVPPRRSEINFRMFKSQTMSVYQDAWLLYHPSLATYHLSCLWILVGIRRSSDVIPHLTRSHDKYYTLFKDKKFFWFFKKYFKSH